MVKPTVPPTPSDHFNNPSKEIVAGSGIYSKIIYGSPNNDVYYAADKPNQIIPNSDVFLTTTTTPAPGIPLSNALSISNLSNTSIHIIDDMNVINNYIHYVPGGFPSSAKTFDPRTFLTQSIVNFNLYSISYR